MSADLSCPVCGTELDLAALFAHETDQRALARLAAVSIPLGARVLQYVALFTPPKQRLTAAKKIKLLLQLQHSLGGLLNVLFVVKRLFLVVHQVRLLV